MHNLKLSSDPLVPLGPIGPARLIVAGSFFIMREIEVSLALCDSVVVNHDSKTVHWTLPVSKTDPTGATCVRAWECVCASGQRDVPCAFCALVEQKNAVRQQCGQGADLPLFPTIDGRAVEKDRVVETIEAVAKRLRIPVKDALGRNKFGGHSLRVSGAQWLAGVGIELLKI